jgi:exodeoxyribonuclease-5
MHEVEQMPLEGDRVICLHNNHEAGIFNGMMGTLEKIHTVRGNTIIADIRDDSDRLFFRMGIVADQFGRNKEQNANNWEGELFDFGYALTCHKAQGSEYESGVVIDECFKFQQVSNFNAPRWRYTAATRFKTQDLEYYA